MRALAALGVAVLVGAVTPAGAAATDATPPPQLTVSTAAAPAGTMVTVTGTGLTPSTVFTVQVCGDDGRQGSIDCAVTNGVTMTTSREGRAIVQLLITAPPAACPCIVSAMDATSGAALTIPFVVTGAPVVVTPAATVQRLPKLVVRHASLEGHGSWSAWFAGASRRTLVLTVANEGDAPVTSPLVMTFASSTAARGSLPSPQLDALPPHTTRTFRVPVTMGALSVGGYRVHGTFGPAGYQVGFTAGTSTVPWGLIAILVLGAQLVLVSVRNRVRRRVLRDDPPAGRPTDVDPVVDSIDLRDIDLRDRPGIGSTGGPERTALQILREGRTRPTVLAAPASSLSSLFDEDRPEPDAVAG